jgi:Lrp/AsnC family transcriptional regulator, leucine-responsive regulatory protein
VSRRETLTQRAGKVFGTLRARVEFDRHFMHESSWSRLDDRTGVRSGTMQGYKFDRIDLKILTELQKNGRIPNTELAQLVGLSPAPCHRRVRDLEEVGIIEGYVALLNMPSVALKVDAFVSVRLDSAGMSRLGPFEEAVRKLPEVIECYCLSGDWDYILHVVVPDLDAFERFLRLHLAQLPGIGRIHSGFALRQVTRSTVLPLGHLVSQ